MALQLTKFYSCHNMTRKKNRIKKNLLVSLKTEEKLVEYTSAERIGRKIVKNFEDK